MWIETFSICRQRTKTKFHLWAIRDVDWNIFNAVQQLTCWISSLSNQRCGLKLYYKDLTDFLELFHLWAIRDVDWNGSLHETWIKTAYFISEQSEMWIETCVYSAVTASSIEFHLWAIRDVDWNLGAAREMKRQNISSLSNQRCGLKHDNRKIRDAQSDFISEQSEMWIETLVK